MAEEKKNPLEGASISATKGGKVTVTRANRRETKKTLDLFGALFSQKSPPINFTIVKVSCVCGVPLNLHLRKPCGLHISWGTFCKDCRRHIQFAITEGPL